MLLAGWVAMSLLAGAAIGLQLGIGVGTATFSFLLIISSIGYAILGAIKKKW